ncbi:O-antigen ligase-related protein [Rhodopirellula maiorica SM1]|uniref:O-antigen ligase-related protein n=1 Tax=Rhodopirellula maiorica SM1 TaxID=1265738 RepID=M5RCD2_9BACT|nr:O-antigen ligase family protein [Rhodopirellula maiorica]EMI17143.1 O-antigen ligase-related protein [Rhodopirellula maiorica SM1]
MMFLVVLFALAAIVWMLPLIQTGRTFQIATLVLVTGTVFGPSFFAIDGPIQLSLDRMMWGAMFAFVAIRWRMGELRIPQLNRVDAVVAAITGWLLVSVMIGGADPPNEPPPIAKWLFCIAMPAGMYVIARVSEVTESDLKWAYRVFLGLGLYLAVMAIFEVSGIHALVFPRYIVDPADWEFFGRGRGPLLNPSGNGIVMCGALAIAVLGVIRSTFRMRAFYVLLCMLLIGGVYCTLTRSAWLGAIATIGVVALVYSPRWVRVLGLATAVLIGGAGALGLKDQLLRMKRDKNLTSADAEKSIQLRPLLAVVAWEMFKDRPITGHGFGHYFAHSSKYHSIRSYDMPLKDARPYAQHNVFLAMLVDAGLIGLSMLVVMLLTITSMAWNLARDEGHSVAIRCGGLVWLGVFAAYFCNGMFQDVTIIPMVNMFLFFAAGLAVSLYDRGVETVRVERPGRIEPFSAVSMAH